MCDGTIALVHANPQHGVDQAGQHQYHHDGTVGSNILDLVKAVPRQQGCSPNHFFLIFEANNKLLVLMVPLETEIVSIPGR